MSAKWGFNKDDLKSVARHTVIPILSGGVIAGIEVAISGTATIITVKTAFLTAIGSGVINFLKRWSSNTGGN